LERLGGAWEEFGRGHGGGFEVLTTEIHD